MSGLILAFGLGIIAGTIITLLVMLVFFVVGYNTIGTLLQVFKPDVVIPSIRELQTTREKELREMWAKESRMNLIQGDK